jgi:hypothetical protein
MCLIWKAKCISQIGVQLGKLPVVWKALICRQCGFIGWISAEISQTTQVHVIADLMSALWMVNLMSALNRSLSNREWSLRIVPKALTSSISICYPCNFLIDGMLRYSAPYTRTKAKSLINRIGPREPVAIWSSGPKI